MLERMLNRFPLASRIVASALMTVAVLALLEWSLSDDEWSSMYRGDPHSMWWLKGGLDLPAVPHLEEGTTFSVVTNELGLRDGLMPAASPWVLALGCSTTFGWGVEAEQAWPAVLERELGVPVVNGGIPGHSTHQGRQVLASLLGTAPDVIIFGWGLRDAQWSTIPDSQRTSPSFPRSTALYRALRHKLQTPIVSKGTLPRVSKAEFEENLKVMVGLAESAGSDVILLDMTGRADAPTHGDVLTRIGPPVVVPELVDSMVFEYDPIHLNEEGNEALAVMLARPISVILEQREGRQQD